MMMTGIGDEENGPASATLALDTALAELALGDVETMARDLVGARERVDAPALRKATEQVVASGEWSKDQERVVLRVVKDLARIVVKTATRAAMNPDDVNVFLYLDENLAPLMEFMVSVSEKLEAPSESELLRWTPFAIHASAHFVCGQLPAHDAMRCTQLAEQTIEICQRLHQKATLEDLLSVVFDRLVALSSQDVSKEDWIAEHSMSKHVFEWLVMKVQFPHLGGEVLGRVLALVFPLVDDLTDSTQLVGARMLAHIVRNVTDTELRWYKEVLLEVLRGAITTRKPATLDCLLDVLVVSLDKISPPEDFEYYDRFFPRLLNDCSLTSEVAVRVLYTRHFRAIISRIGAPHSLHLIRFLQPLLKVLVASFESVNSSLMIATLETLRLTVLGAWPRIPAHMELIVVGVLKAVALCEAFQGAQEHLPTASEREEILRLSEEILKLLADLDRPHVTSMLEFVASESHALKPFASRMLKGLT